MALRGRHSPTRSSARATILGATLAVGVISMALTFAASFSHLLHTPRLSGLTWDYANPRDSARGGIVRGSRTTGDQRSSIRGGREARHRGTPGRRRGLRRHQRSRGTDGHRRRRAARTGEILLGTKIFGALGVKLGDRITVRRGNRSRRMLVVGRGVLPDGLFIDLGEGSAMTFDSLHAVLPGAFRSRFLIRIAPERTAGRCSRARADVRRSSRAAPERDLGLRRRAPDAAADRRTGGLAATATLARNGLTTVRRRRCELAILATLGFTRGRYRGAVAWQATIVVAIGTLVGVPLGAGAGPWRGTRSLHTPASPPSRSRRSGRPCSSSLRRSWWRTSSRCCPERLPATPTRRDPAGGVTT